MKITNRKDFDEKLLELVSGRVRVVPFVEEKGGKVARMIESSKAKVEID